MKDDKPSLSILLGKGKPGEDDGPDMEDEGHDEDEEGAKRDASSALMDALESKDPDAVTSALETIVELLKG